MSSVGRKVLMSFAGLALSLFLLVHVAGNLVLLSNPAKFNAYAHMLTGSPLLIPAELGLLFLILLHAYIAVRLTQQNREARPVAYEVKGNTKRSRRWFGSSSMAVTGVLILAFIVYHIIHFKYGAYYSTTQDGVEMRDLAKLVNEEFAEQGEAGLYVIAMLVIMVHLLHGVRSIWETLGVSTHFWDRFFMWASRVYVIAVMVGFIAIPIIIYLRSPM